MGNVCKSRRRKDPEVIIESNKPESLIEKIKAWFGPEKSPYGTMDMTDVINLARAGDLILI